MREASVILKLWVYQFSGITLGDVMSRENDMQVIVHIEWHAISAAGKRLGQK